MIQLPSFTVIDGPRWDHSAPVNPAFNSNPNRPYASWMNTTTGELFICIDWTRDANIWQGQLGTYVYDKGLTGWSFSTQGGSGTYSELSDEVVLTPVANSVNSVAMSKDGSFSAIEVDVQIESDGSNLPIYLNIWLGSGGFYDTSGGTSSWYHTALENGFGISTQTNNDPSGLLLKRMDGAGVASTTLGNGAAPVMTDLNTFRIELTPGNVNFIVNGSSVGSFSVTDKTITKAMIAQGEYSDGRGGIAHIKEVSLS